MNNNSAIENRTTGIDFLDELIPNSDSGAAVHGIFGSTGSGLTTLLCMITAECTQREVKMTRTGSPGKWVFLSSQTSMNELRLRIISYLSDIFLESFEGNQFVSRDPDSNPLERIRIANHIIEEGLKVIDANEIKDNNVMTPMAMIKPRIEEIDSIAGIAIDDVDFLLHGFLSDSNGHLKSLSRLTTTFLSDCRVLSDEHECPIWLAHHLRGAVHGHQPRALLTHYDAAGCKKMVGFLDSAFVLGNKDSHGVFQVRCTKPCHSDSDSIQVVRFGLGGATIETVPPAMRTEFLTDSWKKPRIYIRPETMDFIENKVREMNQPTPEEKFAVRLERAIELEPRSVNH